MRFFINETRRSLARFRDEVDEDIWLIYNDEVVFSGRHLHTDVSVCCVVYDTRGLLCCVRHSFQSMGQQLRGVAEQIACWMWRC